MKPPLGIPVPACTTHADDRIALFDEGLETEQVVSVGRKSEPVKEILDPVPLKEIVGVDSTVMNVPLVAVISSAQISSFVIILMVD